MYLYIYIYIQNKLQEYTKKEEFQNEGVKKFNLTFI